MGHTAETYYSISENTTLSSYSHAGEKQRFDFSCPNNTTLQWGSMLWCWQLQKRDVMKNNSSTFCFHSVTCLKFSVQRLVKHLQVWIARSINSLNTMQSLSIKINTYLPQSVFVHSLFWISGKFWKPVRKRVCECEWLFVPIWFYNKLATCPVFHPAFILLQCIEPTADQHGKKQVLGMVWLSLSGQSKSNFKCILRHRKKQNNDAHFYYLFGENYISKTTIIDTHNNSIN